MTPAAIEALRESTRADVLTVLNRIGNRHIRTSMLVAAANEIIALIRPAVLREIADGFTGQIDELMREGSDASRMAAQMLVGHVNHLRTLADAAAKDHP